MANFENWYKRLGNTVDLPVAYVLDRYVAKRESALDLGAGNLRHSKFFLRMGFDRVLAVDNNVDVIQYWNPRIELRLTDLRNCLPESRAFDYVICRQTMYCFRRDDMQVIIDKAFIALRPGGVLLCDFAGEKDDLFREIDTCVTRIDLDRFRAGWLLLDIAESVGEANDAGHVRHIYDLVVRKP